MTCSVCSYSGHWRKCSHGVALMEILPGVAARGGEGCPRTRNKFRGVESAL